MKKYIFSAVLGDFYLQIGDDTNAGKFLLQARQLTPSLAEKKLLMEKLHSIKRIALN